MASELNVRVLSNETTIATFRNVLFVHFRGPTLANCVPPMRRALAEMSHSHKSIVFFSVIEEESPPPAQDARDALGRFFTDNAEKLSCVLVTYRGEGFRAAMVRTVASGILSLMPRMRFPKHVAGSPEEAAKVAQQHAPELDAAELLAAFRDLSSRRPAA